MKVIVTGASGGIGRGIAKVLAGDGCAVGALARSGDKLESLREEISAAGGTCHTSTVDLRSQDETAAGIASLTEALGGVDALINNAGIVILKSALEL
ncbi:MAG: SDR family NAD(P)-dependent oxidoreductase, partial [Planctomycetota bacterium]|nr:SDR family NAD(P)-dependent oxidoreductase [Planctomycetota bacterium]